MPFPRETEQNRRVFSSDSASAAASSTLAAMSLTSRGDQFEMSRSNDKGASRVAGVAGERVNSPKSKQTCTSCVRQSLSEWLAEGARARVDRVEATEERRRPLRLRSLTRSFARPDCECCSSL